MGCNAIDFSSRINEEIKSKHKKIFIGRPIDFDKNDLQKYLIELRNIVLEEEDELMEQAMKNLVPTFFHYKVKPVYRFFNYFVLRLGFLDGKEGYTIAKLHAISVANRYKYLDEIYQEENLKTSLNKEV